MTIQELPDFNSMWDYNNPEETGKKFNEILQLAESSGNKQYLAELLTQIARTEGLQMKFEGAHKTLDKANELIEDGIDLAKVRYLLERGRVYNSSKIYDKARELFLETYKLSNEKKYDFYTIDAAHMMGIVEKGNESLKWNEIAMKHAESSDDQKARGWLGSLYNNTGWTYHDMGEYDKARDIFEKNVTWHIEHNTKQGLIIAKWCVAKTLRSLGRTEEALNMQLALRNEIKEKELDEDGYISEETGECLLVLNRPEESKPYFKKAYELLSADIWLRENEKERLERLKNLSE